MNPTYHLPRGASVEVGDTIMFSAWAKGAILQTWCQGKHQVVGIGPRGNVRVRLSVLVYRPEDKPYHSIPAEWFERCADLIGRSNQLSSVPMAARKDGKKNAPGQGAPTKADESKRKRRPIYLTEEDWARLKQLAEENGIEIRERKKKPE